MGARTCIYSGLCSKKVNDLHSSRYGRDTQKTVALRVFVRVGGT